MNVHWTESALADLQSARAYIARHSPQYAHGMIERVFARSEQLENHPHLGAIVPEFEDDSLREVFKTHIALCIG